MNLQKTIKEYKNTPIDLIRDLLNALFNDAVAKGFASKEEEQAFILIMLNEVQGDILNEKQ